MRQRGDKVRRAVRQLHLWMGLTLGALLMLLGLTGSMLVFYPELDAMLHPQIRIHASENPDWDQALTTLRHAYPDKNGPWRFEVTRAPGAIPARYYNPPERAGYAFRPMMVWLSPDGQRVLRRDYWGEYAVTFIYDIHFRLLMGTTGGAVLGWTGLALLVLLISGLWAWWPRGSWYKALRCKLHGTHPQRQLRDWHKLVGLSGLPFLLILTITGVMLELPAESDAVLGTTGLPVDPPLAASTAPSTTGRDIGPSIAARAALAALPGSRVAWIETPAANGGSYRLRMQVPGDPSYRFPHSYVLIDAASAAVLGIQNAREASGGSVVNNWVHSLHDGSAGGIWGRIAVLVLGLFPAALFLTGLLRWNGRRL